MMIDNEMIDAILVSVISSVVVMSIVGAIGFFVFKNNQKNKNVAVDVRFGTIDKDIAKNDERIRKDFDEQNERNDSTFKNIMNDVKEVRESLVTSMQKILLTESGVEHLKDSMEDVSGKLDKVLDALLDKKTSD